MKSDDKLKCDHCGEVSDVFGSIAKASGVYCDYRCSKAARGDDKLRDDVLKEIAWGLPQMILAGASPEKIDAYLRDRLAAYARQQRAAALRDFANSMIVGVPGSGSQAASRIRTLLYEAAKEIENE